MQPLSSEAPCVEWRGAVNRGGYGYGPGFVLAHRKAYMDAHCGPIPKGSDICHVCDNRRCMSPAHLFRGTRKENIADCINKGRMPRGEARPNAKLTEQAVREIRVALASGETGLALAERYGVKFAAISKIKTGRLWKHVAA